MEVNEELQVFGCMKNLVVIGLTLHSWSVLEINNDLIALFLCMENSAEVLNDPSTPRSVL